MDFQLIVELELVSNIYSETLFSEIFEYFYSPSYALVAENQTFNDCSTNQSRNRR